MGKTNQLAEKVLLLFADLEKELNIKFNVEFVELKELYK